MVRFLVLNVFIVVHTVIFCLWGLAISLMDRDGDWVHRLCAAPWARIVLWACGVRVQVRGLENIRRSSPYIFMVNHQSYFDIFAVLAYIPVSFKFVLKRELMRIPLFGVTLKRAGHIGIDRADPKKAVMSMNRAAERIRDGASVLIFPEGTRSEDGELLPFKKGGFHLALKSEAHIVPMAIQGSRSIVPKGSLRVHRGSFAMVIGEPIDAGGYTKEHLPALMQEVRDRIALDMKKESAG